MKRIIVIFAALLLTATPPARAGSTRTDLVVMKPQLPGAIVCPTGLVCLGASSTSGKPYLIDNAGGGWPAEEAQALWRRTTAPGSPTNGSVYFNTMTGLFQFYSGSWFTPAPQAAVDALERPFLRTCTITSAAAATPIVCLADADVPAGKKAYLQGWHAKVDGGTSWATTTVCRLGDTSGVGGIGIIMINAAVAALTANAFISDHSANVTQENAYALGTAGVADLGLQVACDLNGTGSNLVVAMYGVIK